MLLGVALPQYTIDAGTEGPWTACLRAARSAERLGVDAVWLSDHPFAVAQDGTTSGALEALVTASALIHATRRIRVGTLVLAGTMRAPALVALASRTVASGSPKRLALGVGTGWYAEEHHAFGLPFPPFAERAGMLERTLVALAADPESPEIVVGGSGPKVRALAAAHADAWNLAWDVPVARFRELSRFVDAACEERGRDPSTLRRSVGLTVLVGGSATDMDRAVERLRRRAPFLAGLTREALAERIVCGTPAECAERIAAYRAGEVVAALLLRDDPEMLALFATEVAPLLRDA